MVQTIINLSQKENKFVNVFKAKRGISTKNEAVKAIVREYEENQNKQEDEDFLLKVKETIAKYEKSKTKRKLSKKEFLDELDRW